MALAEPNAHPGSPRRRLPRVRWLAAAMVALMLATAGETAVKVLATARAINPRVTVGDMVSVVANQADIPGSLAHSLHNGERVNILLLGYGGAGHDGGYLTDSRST